MGRYLNTGNDRFRVAKDTRYIDKSGLIAVINATLNTEQMYSCVTRSRRFGKSMAAKMLCAYYDKSCDSLELFADLEIAQHPSFEKHLNKYPVIYLDMTTFLTEYRGDNNIVEIIKDKIAKDIAQAYPDVRIEEGNSLMETFLSIVGRTGEKFFMIIDEWDAILREFTNEQGIVTQYIDMLRRLFKGNDSSDVFSGAYLTGILPIKRYNTESALNNFWEYSMIDPGPLAGYYGFRRSEVEELCKRYNMDYSQLALWYDGYCIGDEPSIFNPSSVIKALERHRCQSYWAATGAYDQVASYIDMNHEGLKDDIIRMLAGERCHVDTTGFANDMNEVKSKDDVLTVLIHLGYLAYDWDEEECFIPNTEVRKEMANAIKSVNWKVAKALEESKKLLTATIEGDADAVALGIERVHENETSILSYNDENSLACVLRIAYYHAMNDYVIEREFASGKGFADMVFIPRKNVEKPAMVIELKFDKTTRAAIAQIKEKNYCAKVAEYTGDILLVGINYDSKTKTHSCEIERVKKDA